MQAAVVTGCTGAVGLGLIDALMKNNVKVIAVVERIQSVLTELRNHIHLRRLNAILVSLINCHSLCRRQELSLMCSITLGGRNIWRLPQ